jgi:serine/threonine-protein kinase
VVDDLVGRSLGRRYDVLELVGAGGMGAVYRVLDRELDEVVALKVILAELATDPVIVEHFRSEVRLARRVTHKNVARTFELGRIDDLLFCTMELVEGESLAKLLARRVRLPIDEAVAIACAVCEGLAAAHDAGVIHRDVKPDNVLVDRDGRVVLTDFGVAAVMIDRQAMAGTPPYMALEQMRGEAASPAGDVYSVGVLLHEMLTGKRAFDGTLLEILDAKLATERLVTPSVPAGLDAAIGRATARELADRFSSARELARALAAFAGTAPVPDAPAAFAHPGAMVSVVVHPPRADEHTLYIAQAVHDELMHRLARVPRIRVASAGDAQITVELDVGSELVVTISRGGERVVLPLPLAVVHVELAAEVATAAISAQLGGRPASSQALDLLLQARAAARAGVARFALGAELLEKAANLAPQDPRIAATLAIAKLQRAFFATAQDRGELERAGELARFALGAAPELYEAQLAAGQLELHVGEPARAAGHFRIAIACAPHDAVAHEQLGRMLLEAGHLDDGLSRLREAVALAPRQISARWEIARARALEGDWGDYDRLVRELAAAGQDTVLGELRFVCWRPDLERVRWLRSCVATGQVWEPALFEAMFAVICDGAWHAQRDLLVALGCATDRPSRRRRVIAAQLVTEAACHAGDYATAETTLAHAVHHGLFDLHWLDRYHALGPLRGEAAFSALRDVVARRADAIRDALYGDHSIATLAEQATRPARP